MAGEKLGYVEILADLEAKKAAIEATITALRTALTIGALGTPSGDVDLSAATFPGASAFNGSTPVDLPKGALLGKSLPAAIKIYLSAMKRKQTTREIATALKEVGSSPRLGISRTSSLARSTG
jgi:hypothetical protein